VPSLEMLARYGEDLLSAVASLERHGVVHRDIKPDNIAIRSLTKERNQLVLFDFSLARAPLDNLRVGTAGYTDPFLVHRKPQRWDLAAERYSVGVTLYEMTMGNGVLPQWGDGKSDPALTDDELVLDAEKFDSSVREGLVEFFLTALHRDPIKRFDNAEEMRWAWQEVFKEAEQRKVETPSGEEIDLAVTLEQADLKTPIAALALSTRARNALERAEVLTVRNLLEFPISDIHMMRGVGNQTRQEIIRFVSQLRERFPTVEPVRPKTDPTTEEATGPPTLEVLQHRVVGVRTSKKEAEWNVRAGLLGTNASDSQPASQWPSQTDIAEALSITRARIGQVLTLDRQRWSKDPLITAFRHELCDQIQRLGGVVTVPELIELTLLLRPAANTPEPIRQQRMASAVARAAVRKPRWRSLGSN
jgi:serine/threonine protein kinase